MTVFGHAMPFFAWLGRRKIGVTWEMVGMKEVRAARTFPPQIKHGNLCVLTVLGQAMAFFAWLGRRKRRVTWKMTGMEKSSRRANFCSPN